MGAPRRLQCQPSVPLRRRERRGGTKSATPQSGAFGTSLVVQTSKQPGSLRQP
jgi:hypothetical protein